MREAVFFLRVVLLGWWRALVGAPDNSEAAQQAHLVKLRIARGEPLLNPGVRVQTIDELLAEAGLRREVNA